MFISPSWLRRLASPLLVLSLFGSAQAQTLSDIVARHVQALGGADTLRAAKTLQMEGSTKVMLFITMTIRNVIANGEGMSTSIILNGDEKSRIVTTRQGSVTLEEGKRQPLDPREAAGLFDETDLAGPFVDSEKKGIALKLLGEQTLKGIGKTYVLEVQRGNDRPASRHYIRADNYLLARMETRSFSTEDKQWKDEWTEYDDYRAVDGLVLPHRLRTDEGEITVSSYKVNAPVDRKIFTP